MSRVCVCSSVQFNIATVLGPGFPALGPLFSKGLDTAFSYRGLNFSGVRQCLCCTSLNGRWVEN